MGDLPSAKLGKGKPFGWDDDALDKALKKHFPGCKTLKEAFTEAQKKRNPVVEKDVEKGEGGLWDGLKDDPEW